MITPVDTSKYIPILTSPYMSLYEYNALVARRTMELYTAAKSKIEFGNEADDNNFQLKARTELESGMIKYVLKRVTNKGDEYVSTDNLMIIPR